MISKTVMDKNQSLLLGAPRKETQAPSVLHSLLNSLCTENHDWMTFFNVCECLCV